MLRLFCRQKLENVLFCFARNHDGLVVGRCLFMAIGIVLLASVLTLFQRMVSRVVQVLVRRVGRGSGSGGGGGGGRS